MEQIEVIDDEDYMEVINSLQRQNPDIVYIAEISDVTAIGTLKVANVDKVVFSTIHANSISDVISRIEDMTHLSYDRIILTMHSCVYQKLLRDDESDSLYPINRCVYFSEELKENLLGKTLGEIRHILKEVEDAWHL